MLSDIFHQNIFTGTSSKPYGIQNIENLYYPDILLCRHLRQPWDQFWKNFRSFD